MDHPGISSGDFPILDRRTYTDKFLPDPSNPDIPRLILPERNTPDQRGLPIPRRKLDM